MPKENNIEISELTEGMQLYKDKQWKEALNVFLSADTVNFSNEERLEVAYYLGLCYTKLGQYEEALLYLEQVVTSSADILRIFQCRMTLAYIYVITKRIRMAEFELKKLHASGFESSLLYNALGYAAWCKNQNKDAIELYEKSLEIDTNNTTAMNCLGYILADSGTDCFRGLRLCKKAVDMNPNKAAYLDSLGWAYYKNGDAIEARTWLRRALDLAPDEKEIRRHFKVVAGE